MIADVLVERDLLRAMPPAPPALAVSGLVHDDPVHPGAQGRVAAEAVNGAENAEKHLLRKVERFVVVAEEVQRKLVDHALVLAHQLRAGLFVARGTTLNQRGFTPSDVRPGDGWNWLHKQSFCHLTTPITGNPRVLKGLEPGQGRKFQPSLMSQAKAGKRQKREDSRDKGRRGGLA